MIPDLCGVVVDAAGWRFLDDGFQIQRFKFASLDQIVQVGHIGLMNAWHSGIRMSPLTCEVAVHPSRKAGLAGYVP